MQLSDFDFDLPEGLIATRPARPRSSARLLVAEGDAIHDQVVTDLVTWLRPGDRLVLKYQTVGGTMMADRVTYENKMPRVTPQLARQWLM